MAGLFFRRFFLLPANGFPGFLSLRKNPLVYWEKPWVQGKSIEFRDKKCEKEVFLPNFSET